MARDERGRRIVEQPKPEKAARPSANGFEVYDALDHVKRGAKRTDSWVRRNPWKSVGIAATLGALLARLWRRR